ncbi:MAG: acetoacetyl-CoA synthase [Actinomycetia bacterium]|nr:acetoacetyl-CoA synthase [Actinomycetes bacterium]
MTTVAARAGETRPGEILWRPPADVLTSSAMGRYLTWLEQARGLSFGHDYHALWRWSTSDLAGFWGSLADYMGVRFHDQPAAVLTDVTMPGTNWFPGATLNFAEHALAGPPEATVVVARSETRPRIELTRGELRARVASLRAALRGLGVGPGDRVAAYLPNIPEALITLYAAASLGAIFTCCAPESGTRSVISRIGQVGPAVLVTVDGYVYGGQRYDRTAEVAAIRAAVPSIRTTVAVPYLERVNTVPDSVDWHDLMAQPAELEFAAVPFAHPLYIVYSSGTTGRPKAIVHGHGGILLEHLKLFLLHDDLGPADRWFWYSSTNWMAWNYGASVLLGGGSLLIFDGHPMRPELADYWRMVGDEGVTCLGTSPGFLLACQKEGLVPRQAADLSALRTINCGGAPLTADGFRWVYRAVTPDGYLGSGSGGTDVASSFVSGCRLLPVRAGEIACRLLGVDAQAFSDAGQLVVGERGELVIRQPMPSMPVGFWGDTGGGRLFGTYFERFPGVWCHGDWVTFSAHGSCQVTGRSDATLNRGGVRLGTSEFYAVIDEIEELSDSLVVHLEDANGGPGQLILFVATRDGASLTGEAAARIRSLLREELSPRHQPDLVRQVAAIPRTLTGKRMEVPVKRVLLDPGAAPAEPGEADALAEFRDLGRQLAAAGDGARRGTRNASAPRGT